MIDFDEFWKGLREERAAARRDGLIEWEIVPKGTIVEIGGLCWSVDWVRFSSAADMVILGWIARPSGHKPNGTGLLWIPGYSYGTPPPDDTNLIAGAATLCINVHGRSPDEPYINPAGKNDYIGEGIDDPGEFILRKIALHCMYAVDVFTEIGCADPGALAVGGMSKGGALALLVAANHPAPRLCFADMPFLCSVREALTLSHSPVYKAVAALMSAKPKRAAQILDTICLFDPIYHAPRIRIPVAITAGGRDPASRAQTIEPVFDALGSNVKQYRFFPDAGHEFLPEMQDTYRNWMSWLLSSSSRRSTAMRSDS